MKVVVIQAGGMADEPIAELGGRTPLEAAATPHLDRLASRGILGLTRTVPRGLPPASHVSALSVLGYDPRRYPCARAPLEAAALGIPLGPGDVAFRLDLVAVEAADDGTEVLRDATGGGLTDEEGRLLLGDLARALAREGLAFHAGSAHRHLLVWHGGEGRMRTVPPAEVLDRPVAAALPEGPGAAVLRELMAGARGVLARHPLCVGRRARGERAPTAVWLWGQGRRLELPALGQRFGVAGAVVSADWVVRGLGAAAGLRAADPPEPGAEVARVLETLGGFDFVLLHLKGPDLCGHRGDVTQKVAAIEALDAEIVGPLLDGLAATGADWRLMVLPDHATPCAHRRHTAEPVPFVVAVAADAAKAAGQARGFRERDARELGIFVSEAHTLLERVLRPG
jgi:2,3-bisphosphoglycerate-independent phosphoglycerate mutase